MEDLQDARAAAWELILKCGVARLPVDLRLPLAELSVITLDFDELKNKELADKEEIFASEDGTAAFIDGDRQKIIAVDGDPGESRLREAIAAQLGHFALSHLCDCRRILRRSDKFYAAYDNEARDFARRLLCPSIVLYRCQAIAEAEIAGLCGIGADLAAMASAHMRTLLKRGRFLSSPLEACVDELFSDFVTEYLNGKIF
jgi:hypothetical protein